MCDQSYPNALKQDIILNGRYIIRDVLGQGGFGITYKAVDYSTGEYVAIKEYYPSSIVTRSSRFAVLPYSGQDIDNFVYGKQQFLEEAKTLAAFIGNPNIVKVFNYFEEPGTGTAYFAMEYVQGISLTKYLQNKGGRISWQEAWSLLLPIADALSKIHAKSIVHRDIKPDNIIITSDSNAVLLDFGAARYIYSAQSQSLETILTRGFAPMEQYYRRGHQGPWTDVYALAATIYCAVTGIVPPESVERVVSDTLKPPSAYSVIIPGPAETALLKALEVHEENRFRTMSAFKEAIQNGEYPEKEKTTGIEVDLKAEKKITPQKQINGNITDKEIRSVNSDHKEVNGTKPGNREADKKREITEKKKEAKITRRKGMTAVVIVLAAAVSVFLWISGFFSGDSDVLSENRDQSENGRNTHTETMSTEKTESDETESEEMSQDNTLSDDTVSEADLPEDPMALTDSWSDIIAAGKDGTYASKYQIGNTKEIDLGEEGKVTMKLVAMDTDILADDGGKAPMTWIAEEMLLTRHQMCPKDTDNENWDTSEMRLWLRESVFPLLPSEVQENIREVYKYSSEKNNDGDFSTKDSLTKDTIWIPSLREVAFSDHYEGFTNICESNGINYNEVFLSDMSRRRKNQDLSKTSWWWLRSGIDTNYNNYFVFIKPDGRPGENEADLKGGVIIGFCL